MENVNRKKEVEKLCKSTINSQVQAEKVKDLNEQISLIVELLIKSWKDFSQASRNYIVEKLLEDYFVQTGEYPPHSILCRMTEFLLMETHSDRHPDKMSKTEYPIMTIHQVNRRKKRNNLMGSEPILDFLHSKYQLRLPSLFKSTFIKIDS